MAKLPKKAPAKKADQFVVTVTIDNAMYQGTGKTALAALQAVPAPSLDLISSGSVTVVHGDKSKDMFFASMQMKRLLNPHNQEVLIHDLAVGL